jgi:hypothetical protein
MKRFLIAAGLLVSMIALDGCAQGGMATPSSSCQGPQSQCNTFFGN